MTTDSGPDILVLPSPGTLENHKNTNQDWLSAKQGQNTGVKVHRVTSPTPSWQAWTTRRAKPQPSQGPT